LAEMEVSLVHTVAGVLAFNKDGKLVAKSLFPREPSVIAERLERVQLGEVLEETLEVVRRLREEGYGVFTFESEPLASRVHEILRVETQAEKVSWAGRVFRASPAEWAVKTGFVGKEEEYYEVLRLVSTAAARVRVRKAAARRDALTSQAVMAIEELDKAVNLLLSRAKEWYGLHFPELSTFAEKPDFYLRLLEHLGGKEGFTAEAVTRVGVPADRVPALLKAAENSIGSDIGGEDLEAVRGLAKHILELIGERRRLEGYLDAVMKDVAPNLTAVAGPTLGARLIAYAGSLINLSKMPASTIQVLGAEKALFRALRTGARPPKHGVIFQHPLIHQAPRWVRGKIARTVAGKLAIAARLDAYGGADMGEKLRADVERRAAGIRRMYPSPRMRREDA